MKSLSSIFPFLERKHHLPHVVLTGDTSALHLCETLAPLLEERGTWRIKVDEIFVECKGNRALVSATVVEEGHPQTFYILVVKDDLGGQVTVRLDPSTDPIKTRGVKRSIAVVAEDLLKKRINLSVNRHNIQGYLETGTA